jgi:hypothetical protein
MCSVLWDRNQVSGYIAPPGLETEVALVPGLKPRANDPLPLRGIACSANGLRPCQGTQQTQEPNNKAVGLVNVQHRTPNVEW